MAAPHRASLGLASSNAVTVTNSAADTQALGLAVPANSLQGTAAGFIGECFSVDVVGNTDNVITAAPVFSVFVKVVPTGTSFAAGTKAATISWTMPTTAQTNKPWWSRFLLTCRTIGSGGTIAVQGYGYHSGAAFAAGAFTPSWTAAVTATTVNTTVLNNIYVGFGWSAANASNIGRVDQCVIVPIASGTTLG